MQDTKSMSENVFSYISKNGRKIQIKCRMKSQTLDLDRNRNRIVLNRSVESDKQRLHRKTAVFSLT